MLFFYIENILGAWFLMEFPVACRHHVLLDFFIFIIWALSFKPFINLFGIIICVFHTGYRVLGFVLRVGKLLSYALPMTMRFRALRVRCFPKVLKPDLLSAFSYMCWPFRLRCCYFLSSQTAQIWILWSRVTAQIRWGSPFSFSFFLKENGGPRFTSNQDAIPYFAQPYAAGLNI